MTSASLGSHLYSSWSSVWRRRHPFKLRLVVCFFSIAFAVLLVALFGRDPSGLNVIWIANGLLLAYLLLAPRKRWPAYIFVAFLAMVGSSTLLHETWQANLLYNSVDMLEVLTGAFLLRPRNNALPSFTDIPYLFRFIAFAVLGGPLVSGSAMALASSAFWHTPPGPALFNWVTADCLGIAVATPIFVAIFQTDLVGGEWRRNWIYAALLVVTTLAVFGTSRSPVLFIIYPVLILVLVRLGLRWAAVSILFITLAGGWFTLHGLGPLAAVPPLSPHTRPLLLQIFLAGAVFMIYSVSVVLESRRDIELRLEKMARLHSLVTEYSRDAIILVDFNGHPFYVSDAVQTLLGWTREEFAALKTSDLLHPDDRESFGAVIQQLFEGAPGAKGDWRVRSKDGIYRWLEASSRAVRDPVSGRPSRILNIFRDISERKDSENQLQVANEALEALATSDPLTGMANRRRFDAALAAGWRLGVRERHPVSLLMIDVDHFKAFNDTYGHPRGDTCLRQIAEAAQSVVKRPGDLVARFGGEEFSVILPNTPAEGAFHVATEICNTLRALELPHLGSPRGHVTVSVGCATMIPSLDKDAAALVEVADAALYQAKQNGRDQACYGPPEEQS